MCRERIVMSESKREIEYTNIIFKFKTREDNKVKQIKFFCLIIIFMYFLSIS